MPILLSRIYLAARNGMNVKDCFNGIDASKCVIRKIVPRSLIERMPATMLGLKYTRYPVPAVKRIGIEVLPPAFETPVAAGRLSSQKGWRSL